MCVAELDMAAPLGWVFEDCKVITYEIEGTPRPQGSKRHVGNGIMVESSKHVANWRAFAKLKATQAMHGQERFGKSDAVFIGVVFYFDRPKKHFTSKGLRETAPTFHVGKPDSDKILRALLDSMTGVVFHDDSQVASISIAKMYGGYATTKVQVWKAAG